jgi:hypothetical protein
MIKKLIFLFGLIPLHSLCQGYTPFGARMASMGNAGVALEDMWSYHHNPAALTGVENFSVGLAYENRFLLRELQSQALTVVLPLKTGVISVGAQMYGYELYRSQKAGMGYSLKLSEKFSAGIQMNYQGIRLTDNYGSKHTVTAEAGVMGEITEDWKIGMSVFNLGRAKLAEFADDRFSTVMRLGTSYTLSKVVFVAEAEKDLDHAMRIKGGFEYEPIDHFYFRFGAGSKPVDISFGFGYKWRFLQLDLGSSYHQQLGWSPHFSLNYSSQKKK